MPILQYVTPANTGWAVPRGVYFIKVSCVGGGATGETGGSGGGGGGFGASEFGVVPGAEYSITISNESGNAVFSGDEGDIVKGAGGGNPFAPSGGTDNIGDVTVNGTDGSPFVLVDGGLDGGTGGNSPGGGGTGGAGGFLFGVADGENGTDYGGGGGGSASNGEVSGEPGLGGAGKIVIIY